MMQVGRPSRAHTRPPIGPAPFLTPWAPSLRRSLQRRRLPTLQCQRRCSSGKMRRCRVPRQIFSASWMMLASRRAASMPVPRAHGLTAQCVHMAQAPVMRADVAPPNATPRLRPHGMPTLTPYPVSTIPMQLKTAQLRLHQREECISMLDRYWANLESRLHSVIEQLDSANNGSEEVSSVVPRDTLLQKIYTGDANEQIPLDEAFRARCEATATLAEAAARALATALPLSGDEASRNLALKLSKVEAETSRLSAELALAADRVVAIERDRRDVLMRLSDSQSELERKTKDLQKAKTEILQLKGDGTSRLPVSSASAPPEAGASVSANGMLGVDKASLPSADLDKLRADIEAAAEERAAFEMAAESARKELKLAQCEVASLRAKLEEASYRPPTEEQITRTKRFLHMQREAEQGRQAAHMVERLRMDMATLQQRHAAELVHNEELHARQFEEMRTEAERMSMQLAQVSCERDAYQHRLSQHNISQRSLEERLAESERVLTLWRTEAERVLRDLHRERSRLADVEAQRDAARAESESQRQKAEGLRLELEAREQLPVDDALATAQAKCQDALVRLGGAEVAALQAKEDLAKSRKENDALVEELDSIAKAFDESQVNLSSLCQASWWTKFHQNTIQLD
eukprot:scaffold169390_cov31-Tisochrysis_lutea.AAC.1